MKGRKIYLKFFAITLLLGLLQTNFFDILLKFPVPIIIFTFSLALLSLDGLERSYFSAFVGGLFLDLLGDGLLGRTSFIFVFFLLLVFFIKKYIFDSLLLYVLACIVFSLIWEFLFFPKSFHIQWTFMLFNLITFVIFYYLLKKFEFSKRDKITFPF